VLKSLENPLGDNISRISQERHPLPSPSAMRRDLFPTI
jgi:hypothetical protein